ncbi:MAG: energy transducer TonB [Methylococcales bacterium]|nr:energy transducer TonB [Methylococcales bacterium]
MNSLPATVTPFDASPALFKQEAKAKIIPFPQFSEAQSVAAIKPQRLAALRTAATSGERKWWDVLLIAVLSVLIHITLFQNFDRTDFDAELIEPEKPINQVEISIISPQPKPVAPPPPPKAAPKPVQKKAVPLKKPKEKPKPVEPVQEFSPVAEPVLDAPPAPPTPPTPAPVEKVTPPRGGAGYLKNPPPVYPEIAMDRGWQGKVLLKVYVKANGKPKTVAVLKTSGKSVLDKEALRTVKKWTFMPARRGTTPIDGWVTVPITFRLR